MKKQYELRIYGRVQGVGFRYAARNQARALGLKGWVENRADGSVYALIQGPEAKCLTFMQWCRKGPGYSWIEGVDISENEPGSLQPFAIRH